MFSDTMIILSFDTNGILKLCGNPFTMSEILVELVFGVQIL